MKSQGTYQRNYFPLLHQRQFSFGIDNWFNRVSSLLVCHAKILRKNILWLPPQSSVTHPSKFFKSIKEESVRYLIWETYMANT